MTTAKGAVTGPAAAAVQVLDELETAVLTAPQAAEGPGVLGVLAYQTVFVGACLLAWQLVSGRWVAPLWMSRPTDIAGKLGEWLWSGTLAFHLATTALEMALGYVLGALVAIGLGLLLGARPLLGQVLSPFLVALYSVPQVALAPLFVLWFGIDIPSKVALVAATVFFLVFFNTYEGVRTVDPDLVNTLRLMGARERDIFRRVMVPAASLWIFTGLKVSVRYALTTAIVGEMIAGNRGIGYLVSRAAGYFDTTGVFAGTIVLMLCGLLLTGVVSRAERFVTRWKAT